MRCRPASRALPAGDEPRPGIANQWIVLKTMHDAAAEGVAQVLFQKMDSRPFAGVTDTPVI